MEVYVNPCVVNGVVRILFLPLGVLVVRQRSLCVYDNLPVLVCNVSKMLTHSPVLLLEVLQSFRYGWIELAYVKSDKCMFTFVRYRFEPFYGIGSAFPHMDPEKMRENHFVCNGKCLRPANRMIM